MSPRDRRRRPSSASSPNPFPELGELGAALPISTGSAMLERETDGSVTLYVNGVPSSALHPDPLHLEFEYMRWMQLVVRCWAEEHDAQEMDCAHLGGGGCSLPRALIAQWERSRHIVVEKDELLSQNVRTWFSLPRSPQLRIRVDDAAAALASWRDDRFDVIIRDVFSGNVTPLGLTALETTRHAARVLRDGGIYLVNCAAPPGTRILADEVATLSSVFPQVSVIAEPAHLSGKRRGNCVLVASDAPLPLSVERGLRSDAVSVRLASPSDVRALARGGRIIDVRSPAARSSESVDPSDPAP